MTSDLDGYQNERSAAAGGVLGQIPNIVKHRKWWLLIPLALGVVISILAIAIIPERYTSQATMLVEAPQLPSDVLGQEETNIVDRRIARIKQQITSRPDLIAMIERHNLYSIRRSADPMSDILEDMREAIEITPTVSEAVNRQGSETIAFTLSFTYSDPDASQSVTQDLMERMLQLDARGNVEQATNTVDFLSDRASRLQEQITQIEGEITAIKARNGISLAEGGAVIAGTQGSYDMQIAAMQRDNQALISQRRAAQAADTRDPLVITAENQLASARSVYSESHPDVMIAKQRLAEARELARATGSSDLAVENLSRQIEFNNSQIAALQSAKARDQAQFSSQLAAQARAPLVRQQIANLERRLSGYSEQFEEVSGQLTNAQTGVQAEDEQMAERLTVVEPPVIPDTPSSPNHLLILLAGIGGGLGLGIGLAFAVEFFLKPIRDPQALESILAVAPLGVIPVIERLTVNKKPNVPSRSFFWRKLARSDR